MKKQTGRGRAGIAFAVTGLAALALALAAGSVLAQDVGDLDDGQNVFISPPGERFAAPVGDPYPIVKWFKKVDANGDGKLDINEFRTDATAFFLALDLNHDGVITAPEVNHYEHAIAPEILYPTAPAEVAGDEPEKLNVQQGAALYSLFPEPEPVTAADRRFDSRITLQEFLDQSDRHFKALDVKHRGYLTLDDLPKTPVEKAAKARRTGP